MNLPRGRDSAITYGALAERLGIPRRSIEKAVRQMRLDGIPVITGNDGAWVAESPQEAREQAGRLRSRAIHIMEPAAALERWADDQEYGDIIQTELGWVA